MLLAKNREAKVGIYLAKEELNDWENSTALYAAKELRYYLDRMTSASFQIEEVGEKAGIYLKCLSKEELGNDGFEIKTCGSSLIITGGRRGIIYGVYEFLESLGCRFFTHNCEKVPTIPELEIGEYDMRKKPVLNTGNITMQM